MELREAEEQAEKDLLQQARLAIAQAAEIRAAGTQWRE